MLMNSGELRFKIKTYFRNLNFYSMPYSILFIVRKRLNLVFWLALFLVILIWVLI